MRTFKEDQLSGKNHAEGRRYHSMSEGPSRSKGEEQTGLPSLLPFSCDVQLPLQMTLTLHPAQGYGKQEPKYYCFHLAVSVYILVIQTKSEPIHDRFQVDYMWEMNTYNQGHKGTKIFTRDECTNGPTIWQSLLRISMAASYTVIRSQRCLLLGTLVSVQRDGHGSMADVSGSM